MAALTSCMTEATWHRSERAAASLLGILALTGAATPSLDTGAD